MVGYLALLTFTTFDSFQYAVDHSIFLAKVVVNKRSKNSYRFINGKRWSSAWGKNEKGCREGMLLPDPFISQPYIVISAVN